LNPGVTHDDNMHVKHVKHFLRSAGRLLMMAIIGRNMQRLNFITKNIVALDGIKS
jgi:hypothetical protein